MSTALTTSWARQQPHTKAIVYFKAGPGQDGRTFYGRELYFNKPVNNPRQYGIDGLKKMIDNWGADKVANALIIDLSDNQEVHKFCTERGLGEITTSTKFFKL